MAHHAPIVRPDAIKSPLSDVCAHFKNHPKKTRYPISGVYGMTLFMVSENNPIMRPNRTLNTKNQIQG